MATSISFINYVCEQLKNSGNITYKKMFGEYMVYLNLKPVVIVCDNIAYVKKLDILKNLMKDCAVGFPYKGAKEHYILDIDNADFCNIIVKKIEEVTKVPKRKKMP